MVNISGPGERTAERLAPELRIAVAYTPAGHRAALEALLAFDAMLGRFVARGSEPLLVQVRLAWWREELARPVGTTGSGDPILAQLRVHFAGQADALVSLVDGWEGLVGASALSADAVARLADARALAFGVFADKAGASRERDRAESAGYSWAVADLAGRADDPEESRAIVSPGGRGGAPLPGSRALRGIAVLGGLGRRALRLGSPLFDGRLAALAAFRLGVLGR
jgi:15-cis-phytoene synthase